MTDADIFITLSNFLVCTAIGYVCVCRLNAAGPHTDPRLRLQFVMLFLGALAHGWEPLLFGDLVSVGGLLMSSLVLIALLLSLYRWRNSSNRWGGFDDHSDFPLREQR